MNQSFRFLSVIALGIGSTFAAHAQGARGPMMGGMQRGPNVAGAMAKLFGDNTAFSASLEITSTDTATGRSTTVPMKFAFDAGKSRSEMDLTRAAGSQNSPMAARMKAMGMDTTVIVSRPDKKATYAIYPGMKAYAETPIPDADAAAETASYKMETAELGKETVDGHACVKNKVTVTGDKGAKHEYTVWNATDLKNFPVKIESGDQGIPMTLAFKDISLTKPAASSFDAPAGFTKYDSVSSLMQTEMAKRARGGG